MFTTSEKRWIAGGLSVFLGALTIWGVRYGLAAVHTTQVLSEPAPVWPPVAVVAPATHGMHTPAATNMQMDSLMAGEEQAQADSSTSGGHSHKDAGSSHGKKGAHTAKGHKGTSKSKKSGQRKGSGKRKRSGKSSGKGSGKSLGKGSGKSKGSSNKTGVPGINAVGQQNAQTSKGSSKK